MYGYMFQLLRGRPQAVTTHKNQTLSCHIRCVRIETLILGVTNSRQYLKNQIHHII